jgi:hypothetical protein
MRRLADVLALFLLFAAFSAYCGESRSEHEKTVKNFVAAFNAQDTEAMSKLVTEDVQWLSISADKISVETEGKSALRSAMSDYFKSCPTCRSKLTKVIATQDRVSAIETASWQSKNGAKRQSSVSVYEFSGTLIRRVYYFPSEK